MSERDPNAAVVEEAFRLLAQAGPQGLLERYDDFFAEDFEWRPALTGSFDGRVYRGRSEFEQYWRDFTEAFEGLDFGAPRVQALGGGRVLASGTVHARGAGGGVPIAQEGAYVIDLREGKIVAGRTFFSHAEAEDFARA
jgi:ketosteroid isomerase-like protein